MSLSVILDALRFPPAFSRAFPHLCHSDEEERFAADTCTHRCRFRTSSRTLKKKERRETDRDKRKAGGERSPIILVVGYGPWNRWVSRHGDGKNVFSQKLFPGWRVSCPRALFSSLIPRPGTRGPPRSRHSDDPAPKR